MTRQTLHGFASWVDFIKATLSLGTTIGAILWAGMLFQLDQRYASASTVSELRRDLNDSMNAAADVVSDVRDLRRAFLESELFELRIRQCGQEGEAHDEIARRLAALENEYLAQYGTTAALPECRPHST